MLALGGERGYSSYIFLTSALDGVSGQRHPPPRFALGKGPPVPTVREAGLASEPLEETIPCPCQESNPDRLVVQPVVRHYTDWATPAPKYEPSLPNSSEKEDLVIN
jgi:hypothetical protein